MPRARRLRRAAPLALAIAALAAAPVGALGAEGRVLVRLAPDAPAAERAEVGTALGATETTSLGGGWQSYTLPTRGTAQTALAELRADGAADAVLRVEADPLVRAVVTSDPLSAEQYALENTGAPVLGTPGVAGADIDAVGAWELATRRARVRVAVIDTGVDAAHPDLRSVDASAGWDFAGNDADVYDGADEDAHGTHVAGTIAATAGNGAGIAGVAPNAEVVPYKFIRGARGGYTSDAIAAIDRAVASGAKVINASWGSARPSRALCDAVDRAIASGVVVVAAAGNSGADLAATPFYPAACPNPDLITVAATDNRDALAAFSNFGGTVDVAAPGAAVLSTVPDGGYAYLSGTSMAAPQVSGAAAVLLGEAPGLTPAQVREALIAGADAGPAAAGGRRIDLARSLALVTGRSVAPPAVVPEPPAGTADTTPPTPAVVTWPREGAASALRRPPIRFTPSEDDESGVLGHHLQVDGRSVMTEAGDGVLRPAEALADGPHRIAVAAVNGDGLVSLSAPVTVVIDTVAPEAARITAVTVTRTGHVRVRFAPGSDATPLRHRLRADGRAAAWTTRRTATAEAPGAKDTALRVESRDAAGNRTLSAPVRIRAEG